MCIAYRKKFVASKSLLSKIGKNELVTLGGELNRHVGKDVNGYDGIQGGFRYGVRNLEGERIL